jgi:4-amino-4-deoxy-L-arabinose transferase-like glycosyltransferase
MNLFTRHSSLVTSRAPRPTILVISHLSLVIFFLLLAFFFRTYQLAGLGLGLEHDEVAEWQIANNIRHGENALFFKEAYGQEPIFLYLMAGSTALIGDNVIGVRFTSVFVAMLTLAAVYRMLRRMFSPFVALIALAGMSIALWPVFWGRVGLRAMTLPLMMCLAFDFLWRGLTADRGSETRANGSLIHRFTESQSLRPFIFAGFFFGLSAYTYLSSRALPILLIAFVIYLALFARDRMRDRWRNLFICFAIAIVIALPLALTIITNPDLQFRVSEVSGPLDQALKGNTNAIMQNIPLAFGMFTDRGDNTVRDNWPDRPVFPEPISQTLFLFGFVIALSKFNQPRYALSLIWIGSMLVPSIVTSGAPNFTRTLGALPMVFALLGIGLEWLSMWPLRIIAMPYQQKLSRVLAPIAIVFLLSVFAINAASTFDDYFNKWPNHPETQFVFQADFAAIAKDIDASNVMDVSVGGLSNDTLDDDSLRLLLQRKDVRIRWFDSGSPISSGGALIVWYHKPHTIYIPSIIPVSPLFQDDLEVGKCGRSYFNAHFQRYEYECNGTPGVTPGARLFEDSGILLGANDIPTVIPAGDTLRFTTMWRAVDPIVYPRHIFVHLIDPNAGRVVAQHDGLDAPTKYWQPNDYISQVHVLPIPIDTAPGSYEIWIGLYDPLSGRRILQTDIAHSEALSDQYLLGTIQVTH